MISYILVGIISAIIGVFSLAWCHYQAYTGPAIIPWTVIILLGALTGLVGSLL